MPSLKSKLAYIRQFAENVHDAEFRFASANMRIRGPKVPTSSPHLLFDIPLSGVFTLFIAPADGSSRCPWFLCTLEVDELEDIIVDWDVNYSHLIPTVEGD